MTIFENKTVLVTGGTGSIGRALVEKVATLNLKKVIVFSRDEMKQEQMRLDFADALFRDKVDYYIGDIRSYQSIFSALKGVDYVFHAAALKEVPSCEDFPMEAVRTNIFGAENVLRASLEKKVKKVVVLSTDKAVYPVNAMGMTKALMEKTMTAFAKKTEADETVFCGVRLGNVMGTRGSVIPRFVQQIKSKRPLTVTNPDMTRFLMSKEDAVNLILQAFEMGSSGDIFVPKVPSCRMDDLAWAVQKLLDVEVAVQIIGDRPGERVNEVLISDEESVRVIDEEMFFRILPSYSSRFNSTSEQKNKSYSSVNAVVSKEKAIEIIKKTEVAEDCTK
jgi:UDP-N-acetylglucosamine 4,6-dehydratase